MSRVRPKYTVGMNDIRRLLDTIGSKEMSNYTKDQVLWNILTALRGPDDGNDHLKDYTTVRLRGKVCPNLAYSAGGKFNSDSGNTTVHPVNLEAKDTQHHFNRHFNWAVDALARIEKAGT